MRSLLEHKRVIRPVVIGDKTYHVRSWNLAERLKFMALNRNRVNETATLAIVLRLSVCDSEGNESFTDEDLPALEQLQDGAAGQRLANESFEINGFGKDAVESAKKG